MEGVARFRSSRWVKRVAGIRTHRQLTSVLIGRNALPSTGQVFQLTDIVPSFLLGGFVSSGGKDSHLLGQHTVRMSPISTAQLNPQLQTFCIANPGQSILVPVLLNNTSPVNLRYSLTPLGYGAESSEKPKSGSVGKIERVDLSSKDLKAIEQARLETLQVVKTSSTAKRSDEDYDEYDDDDEEEEAEEAEGGEEEEDTEHHHGPEASTEEEGSGDDASTDEDEDDNIDRHHTGHSS